MARAWLIAVFVVIAWVPAATAQQDIFSQGAHALCQHISAQTNSMLKGLEVTWSDNNRAQTALAVAQDELHLAALPLQNSDCAAAGKGTPACVALDASYTAARAEVLRLQPAAESTAQTYARNQRRCQTAAGEASQLCQAAIAADTITLRNDATDSAVATLLVSLLKQIDALLAANDPASDASLVVDPNPGKPTELLTPPAVAAVSAPQTPVAAQEPAATPGVAASLVWEWSVTKVVFDGRYSASADSWTFEGNGTLDG